MSDRKGYIPCADLQNMQILSGIHKLAAENTIIDVHIPRAG